MLIREVMSAPAVCVSRDTTLKRAIQLLEEHQITAMPVTDQAGLLVGVVSEADVLRDVVPIDPRLHARPVEITGTVARLTVADVMTNLALSVSPEDDVASAVTLLVDTQVKSLPVISSNRVVGVVSRRDVISVLARQDGLIEAEVDEALRQGGVECAVDVVDGVVTLSDADDCESLRIARVIASRVSGVVGVEGHATGRHQGVAWQP
jgi:CBS domain-containing protein